MAADGGMGSSSQKDQEYSALIGYKWSRMKIFMCSLLGLCTGGVYLFCCYWNSYLWTISTKVSVRFVEADYILCKDLIGKWHEIQVRKCPLPGVSKVLKSFEFRKIVYVLNVETDVFERQVAYSPPPFESLISSGLSLAQVELLKASHGPNSIEVPVKPLWRMALHKALEPFYIFQVASCIVWFLMTPPYYLYATVIIVASFGSATYEVWQQYSNTMRLRDLSRHDEICAVLRSGKEHVVHAVDLVLGDVILLSDDSLIVADCAVISGECVVDESMLTGESVPVVKQAVPAELYPAYDPERHKSNTLYCGSRLAFSRTIAGQQAKAVVVRTAFSTSKGELFRSILFPKPINFSFYRDSYIFIAIMGTLALAAFVQAIVQSVETDKNISIVDCFVLITIAVPPALPLTLTIGTTYALRRLSKDAIYCIDPDRVNLAGKVNLCCFDKTGTLTTDHLDFESAQYVQGNRFSSSEKKLRPGMDGLKQVMLTCHGLLRLHDALVGPAVDRQMFASTGWDLREPTDAERQQHVLSVVVPPSDSDSDSAKLLILRRFEFDSRLQRSSAIVADGATGQMYIVCKGSAEAVRAVCAPSSIPLDFTEVVNHNSRAGDYVLACASKLSTHLTPSEIDSLTRNDVEKDLGFEGLFMMENQLKPSTAETIGVLQQAAISIRMLTGDSALTAICVAKKAALLPRDAKVLLIDAHSDDVTAEDIDSEASFSLSQLLTLHDPYEYAITGAALSRIQTNPLAFEWVLANVNIFARVLPQQKTALVEAYMDREWMVAMCGDGANDCGAMKAAHVGLSLSDAEASIVAPFTSRDKDVSSIIQLFREGKCALATSFAAFKFMCMYAALVLIFELILEYWGTGFAEHQYLWQDLGMVLPMAIAMCMTGPVDKLVTISPASSLFSIEVVGSLFLQLGFSFAFLAVVLSWMWRMPWFCGIQSYGTASDGSLIPPPGCPTFNSTEDTQMCFENTMVWLYTTMQFWIVSIAIGGGGPYRKPVWRNGSLMVVSSYIVSLNIFYLLAYDLPQPLPPWITFNLTTAVPLSFRTLLLAVWALNALLCCGSEVILQQVVAAVKARSVSRQCRTGHRGHKCVEEGKNKDEIKAGLLSDSQRS